MDQLKLEAAIQFGRISALNKMHEDKDIEEVYEIFEEHWKNFKQNLSWGYFADYYQDQVNQHKLYADCITNNI